MVSINRKAIGLILASEGPRSFPRFAIRSILLIAIFIAVGAAVVDTLPTMSDTRHHILDAFRSVIYLLFLVEYLARIWCAPEFMPAVKDAAARVRYLRSPLGIIDLTAFLPFGLTIADTSVRHLGNVLDLFILLKLVRYAPALSLVAAVIKNEARSLWSAFLSMMVLLMLSSGIMYLIERDAQPEVFSSIPRAMWWGIVTMATVGYGDMTPITPLGRVVGGMVMLFGIAMFAVPAGIMATGFASEIRKRDFVVTWQAVARVPLFARLDASDIASISRLLKPLYLPARQAVVRRGETADAMYFILAGEVEVDVAPNPVRLGPGQFFGEVALLNDTMRTATVTTLNECRLLMLDAADFRRLLDQYPDMRANVQQTAAARSAS